MKTEKMKIGAFHTAYPGYYGYYRMYFRNGWSGRWFDPQGNTSISGNTAKGMSEGQFDELNRLINKIARKWSHGVNWLMKEQLREMGAAVNEEETLFLLKRETAKAKFLIHINITYGNGDYPIRIYVYDPVLNLSFQKNRADEKTEVVEYEVSRKWLKEKLRIKEKELNALATGNYKEESALEWYQTAILEHAVLYETRSLSPKER